MRARISRGVSSRILGAKIAEGELQRGQLIFVIVDGEIARQAEPRSFAAKQAHAKGVKRADPGIAGAGIGAFEQQRGRVLASGRRPYW